MERDFQLVKTIPEHLKPFISKQDPSLYTPMDHASWRYIIRVSKHFFKQHAHSMYLSGLEQTGISTDQIPLISDMDAKLNRFGWRAVPIVGFIPPAAFMEFLSLGILPIACDMRQIDHLAYTPAPDIVHEAAGHAPILADPEYAHYLRSYGEISRKAIVSKKDLAVYFAIRKLSDVKEDPKSSPDEILSAQRELDAAVAAVDYVSEATYLSRMAWWTVEYGLIGDLHQPLIYGAGLLSSLSEGYDCISDKVRKIPLTLDCINVTYDITQPQPQLFVAKNFPHLIEVLEEFSETMAFRKGGLEGLAKAKMAETVTTSVLDTEVSVSGVLKDFFTDREGAPSYLQFTGPVQLCINEKEIPNQGADYHKEGFGSPLGLLKNSHKSVADLTETELKLGKIVFESGVSVQGRYLGRVQKNPLDRGSKNIIVSFADCTVTLGDQILFRPEWGTFDMICGEAVTSVYGSAADRAPYMRVTGGLNQLSANPKTNLTEANRKLNSLYQRVREIREKKKDRSELLPIIKELRSYPNDWLIRLEILELDRESTARAELEAIAQSNPEVKTLIHRGLEISA